MLMSSYRAKYNMEDLCLRFFLSSEFQIPQCNFYFRIVFIPSVTVLYMYVGCYVCMSAKSFRRNSVFDFGPIASPYGHCYPMCISHLSHYLGDPFSIPVLLHSHMAIAPLQSYVYLASALCR